MNATKPPRNPKSRYYILDADHNVVATDDVNEWEPFIDVEQRRVALTELPGNIIVSTVFLDCPIWRGNAPPLFFETLIAGGPLDQKERHYHTWAEALAGHARAVAAVAQTTNRGACGTRGD